MLKRTRKHISVCHCELYLQLPSLLLHYVQIQLSSVATTSNAIVHCNLWLLQDVGSCSNWTYHSQVFQSNEQSVSWQALEKEKWLVEDTDQLNECLLAWTVPNVGQYNAWPPIWWCCCSSGFASLAAHKNNAPMQRNQKVIKTVHTLWLMKPGYWVTGLEADCNDSLNAVTLPLFCKINPTFRQLAFFWLCNLYILLSPSVLLLSPVLFIDFEPVGCPGNWAAVLLFYEFWFPLSL